MPEENEPENNKKDEITLVPLNGHYTYFIFGHWNFKVQDFYSWKVGDLKNKCQGISKLKPNKTDNNKPEYNDTDNNEPESLNKAEKENFTELNSS